MTQEVDEEEPPENVTKDEEDVLQDVLEEFTGSAEYYTAGGFDVDSLPGSLSKE